MMGYKHDITMGAISKISLQSTEYDLHDVRITGVDTTPTANSGNVVTSGGVKTALDNASATVSQANTTTESWRKVILSYQYGASGAAMTSNTNVVYGIANVEVQPSTATLKATTLRSSGNNLYIGSASNSQCHQQYDSTNKCLKFIFD